MQNPNSKYVASATTFSKMGYKINEKEKGIKILMPNFLKFIKIINADGSFEIKPLYMLNAEELKKYKDKKDNSVVFLYKKVNQLQSRKCF